MPKKHTLELSEDQRQQLIELRDIGEAAYLRERAAALLKIEEGYSPHKVAQSGLLKKRDPDTVYSWLRRYRENGIQGLYNKKGRGRKPAYSPKSPEEAETEVYNTIAQGPEQVDANQTRWTLPSLGNAVSWLSDVSVSGIHQILSRLGISYKRARLYIHSPDTDYAKKIDRIQQVLEETRQHPQTCVALYQDEFSFYRNPTIAKDWARTGTKTPLAHQSYKTNETCYGIGALNPHTGDVVYQQVSSCTVEALHLFYTEICQRYANAQRIYLIQDNRAIHFHANLLEALLPEKVSFVKPGECHKAFIPLIYPRIAQVNHQKSYGDGCGNRFYITIVIAMTGKPLKKVITFMSQFIGGSQMLLHYVGLLPN